VGIQVIVLSGPPSPLRPGHIGLGGLAEPAQGPDMIRSGSPPGLIEHCCIVLRREVVLPSGKKKPTQGFLVVFRDPI